MNQLIKMPSKALKSPSERLFTQDGALILKQLENAVEAKIGVLYTINGGEEGEEIDYRIYERIKHTILETDARFVETTSGTIIAVNQITKLDEKKITRVSKAEKERIARAKLADSLPTIENRETDEERRANTERIRAKLSANGTIRSVK